jgi:hypothetical protein
VAVVLPYAEGSVRKGRDRHNTHGCVRSERNRCRR